MSEPKLKELSGPSRLALGFFNSLIRRIESIKPLAGDNITIKQEADGFLVSADFNKLLAGLPDGSTIAIKKITVCDNGSPAFLNVLVAE